MCYTKIYPLPRILKHILMDTKAPLCHFGKEAFKQGPHQGSFSLSKKYVDALAHTAVTALPATWTVA